MTEQYRQISFEEYVNKTSRNIGPVLGKKLESKQDAVEQVLQVVADEYEVKPEEILGPSRKSEVALARHVAAHFLYQNTDLSFRGIALSLGRNDHTTILNSIKRVEELMKTDPYFKEKLEACSISIDN